MGYEHNMIRGRACVRCPGNRHTATNGTLTPQGGQVSGYVSTDFVR